VFAVWLWSANSHAWNLCRKQNSALSPQEKITRLLGKSLDQIDEILDIPLAECDPAMLNAKIQVLRVVCAGEREARDRASPERERGARALGIRPMKAKPAKTDPSPARKQ
jgi:hypothetical protein